MTSTTHHAPVILLLGERVAGHDEVDTWLAQSGYSTCEATNVFQALEQISDFTVHDTPDVVFLHVDRLDAELEMLEHMLLDTSAGDLGPCVITLSDETAKRHDRHEVSGLSGLARRLERLIPASTHIN